MRTIAYLSLTLFLFLALSCASVEKQITQGNYDSAIDFAVNKIKGKKKKSPKLVLGLEEAYKLALNQDLERIDHLKKSTAADADLQILRIYEKVDRYQSSIRPLLPIKDKHGYVADITLVNFKEQRTDYANKAADYLYDCAIANLQNAREGNKMAAQEAYSEFQQMEGIIGAENSNITKLKSEAKDLGTTYVLLSRMVGQNMSLSAMLADQFINDGYSGLNTSWKSVQLSPERKSYDLKVNFILDNFDISPEKENTREYQEKKTIEEDTGAKNREGNKITRKVEVVANVIELFQFKEATVLGTIIILDNNTRKEIYRQKMDAKMLFENYASTFKGDKRALSDVSLKRIGGKPLHFPSNEQILGDAIEILKKDMIAAMKKGYAKY
jgi:hypothetical protein